MAAMGLIGGLISAAGSIVGGIAANNQAKAQAKAMEVRAGEERAVSQREAIRRSKEAKMVMSRQQAVAASSGGGAGDPTVVNLMSGVGAEGKYQSGVALYEGETKGRGLEFDADIRRMEGRQALFAGFIGGASSILNGFSNFSQYASSPPPSRTMPSAVGGGGYFYGSGGTMPSAYPVNPNKSFGGWR
jgi:hypothetical protein